MKFNKMTDETVASELGKRIAQRRLEQNLTQQAVADEVGLSRLSYRRLEMGEAKLINFIAVLRVLGQLDVLEQALPEEVFSPIEQLKLAGKKRQRATGSKKNTTSKLGKNSDVKTDNLDW